MLTVRNSTSSDHSGRTRGSHAAPPDYNDEEKGAPEAMVPYGSEEQEESESESGFEDMVPYGSQEQEESESDFDDESENLGPMIIAGEPKERTDDDSWNTYVDEGEERKPESESINCLAILLCLCCGLLLLGLVVFLIWWFVFKDEEEGPTLYGTGPDPDPWPTIIIPVLADTYMRSGDFADNIHGKLEELMTLNVAGTNDTAYMLLQINASALPPDTNLRDRDIFLEMTHVGKLGEESMSVEISMLQPVSADTDIETLSWNMFSPQDNQTGPVFSVKPDDALLEVDITDLIESFLNPAVRLRSRRVLQEEMLLLMLKSVSAQSLSATFYSREFDGGALAPRIVHNFATLAPSGAPSISSLPSVSMQPSSPPSISSIPSLSFNPTVSEPPTVSSEPTLTPRPSPAPSISSAPSSIPSLSLEPSGQPSPNPSAIMSFSPTLISAVPTVSIEPSMSLAPSAAPSISSAPSRGPSLSTIPSVSFQPSISPQPSTCLERITPPFYDIAGATANPFPPGAFEYVSQDVSRVTFRVIQKWSDEPVVWIALHYYDPLVANSVGDRECPKFRAIENVKPGGVIEKTLGCFKRRAFVIIIVNDNTLIEGLDLELHKMVSCQKEDDDVRNKKAAYAFELHCTPPPESCANAIV